MSKYGEIVNKGTIRFERVLPGPIERVWSYLVESEKRAKWLAAGDTEPRKGGAVEFRFRNSDLSEEGDTPPEKYKDFCDETKFPGKVTHFEPYNKLSYLWLEENGDDSEVTFELKTQGESVQLVLTHSRLKDDAMLSVAAGWHTHLGIMIDVLNGTKPSSFWSTHTKLEAEYEQRLA